MKVPSTDLFELIRSLSANEKGYFKKQLAASSSDSKIAELFDFIDSMEVYNEKLILDHFAGETFVNNLSRTKNYLYQTLLQAMRNYHGKIYARIQVKNMVSEIEILCAKALYKQCYQHIQLAKKKALKYECFLALVEILVYELSIANHVIPVDKVTKEVAEISEQIDEIEEYVRNLLPYYKINAEIRTYVLTSPVYDNKGDQSFPSRYERMLSLSKHELLENSEIPATIEARFLRLKINGHLWRKLGDQEKSEAFHKEALELIESNAEFMKEFPSHYLTILNNLGINYLFTGKYDECLALAAKYDEGNYRLADLRIKAEQHKMNLSTSAMLESRDLSKLGRIYPKFEAAWDEYGDQFEPQFRKAMSLNMFLFNFFLEDLSKANHFCNYLINEMSFDLRMDISFGAALGFIALQIDLHNWDLVESKARSMARNSKFSAPIWKEISNHIIRLTRQSGDTKDIYSSLLEKLIESDDDYLSFALSNFDFVAWLDGKVKGIGFRKAYEGNRLHASKEAFKAL